jgi:hypothetical protein
VDKGGDNPGEGGRRMVLMRHNIRAGIDNIN